LKKLGLSVNPIAGMSELQVASSQLVVARSTLPVACCRSWVVDCSMVCSLRHLFLPPPSSAALLQPLAVGAVVDPTLGILAHFRYKYSPYATPVSFFPEVRASEGLANTYSDIELG